MSIENGQNGWNEWSRHVLKELERLNISHLELGGKFSDVAAKIMNYNPERMTRLEIEMQALQKYTSDQETRLRELEQKEAASQVNVTLAGFSSEKVQALERIVTKQQEKIQEMEKREATFSGKWAILAMIGAALISAAVGFMFSGFKSSPPEPQPKERHSAIVEKSLTIEQLASLKESD